MHHDDASSLRADAESSKLARPREDRIDFEMSFRELLELAPDAVLVRDSNRRVIDANTAACKMYGYERDELLGTSMSVLFEAEEEARFVRDLPAIPGRVHVGELHARRKDGTRVPIEYSVKVLPDGRFLAFVRDISERKRAEREREESFRRLRAVLEQSPVALVLVHPDRRVQHNARAKQILDALGVTDASTMDEFHDDLVRRGVIRLANGQPLDAQNGPAMRALAGETTIGSEVLLPNASGTASCFSVSAAPIAGADGTVIGAVMSCEDITPKKELERLRAEWSSVVGHDLRQPLSTILALAQMLERAPHAPDAVARAQHIRTAAQRLNRMVGDLMDISRLDASRLELVRKPVDVAALVRAAAEHASLRASDHCFEVHVEEAVPDADADPDRMLQILENLLTNAVKYGHPGTPVVIRVASDDRDVVVSVTNEGPALTPEEIARIFERFQRTESAKLEGIQGVGLGLYITRSLVEAHGGSITAGSTADGVTTFRFTLPAAVT